MTQKQTKNGFSVIEVLTVIVVIIILAAAGFFVWQKTKKHDATNHSAKGSQSDKQHASEEDNTQPASLTADWASVTTQGGVFSMKVPDGWKLINYPQDYVGSTDTTYSAGTPATIETSSNEYVGHTLRFRANVTALDDAGLGPQWASPQPGLEESVQDFVIDTLNGTRYKGVFSGDLEQTLYEYVFALGNNKKLDIVYTVDRSQGDVDNIAIVEAAIRTIQLHN